MSRSTPRSKQEEITDPAAAAPSAPSSTSGHARALLTVSQAADYLHVSPSSVRSYIRQGQLKAFRVAGLRKVLIHREELLKLLAPA